MISSHWFRCIHMFWRGIILLIWWKCWSTLLDFVSFKYLSVWLMWTFVFLEQLCLFFLIIFQLVDIHYHVTFKRAATFMYFMKWSPRGVPCPSDTVHGWLHSRVPAAALYTPTAIFTVGNLHFLNLSSFFCRSPPNPPPVWYISLFSDQWVCFCLVSFGF